MSNPYVFTIDIFGSKAYIYPGTWLSCCPKGVCTRHEIFFRICGVTTTFPVPVICRQERKKDAMTTYDVGSVVDPSLKHINGRSMISAIRSVLAKP